MLLCNKFKVATPTNLRRKCITNHLNHSPRTKLSWRRPLLEKSRRRLACDADLTSPVAGDCPAVARRSPATCLRHTYVTHDRWLAVAGGRRRLLLSPATEKLLRVKGPLLADDDHCPGPPPQGIIAAEWRNIYPLEDKVWYVKPERAIRITSRQRRSRFSRHPP